MQAIESALQGMRDAAAAALAGDGEAAGAEQRFHNHDVQFHEAVATASGNRIIAFLFEAMTRPLRESFHMSRRGQGLRGAGHAETLAAHQAVLDAIRAGKPRAAAEAMRAHLQDTERDIRASLGQAGAS